MYVEGHQSARQCSFLLLEWLIGEFGEEQTPASCPPLGSQPTHKGHGFWSTTVRHTFYRTRPMRGACGNSVLLVAEDVNHSNSRVSSERSMVVTHLSHILQTAFTSSEAVILISVWLISLLVSQLILTFGGRKWCCRPGRLKANSLMYV